MENVLNKVMLRFQSTHPRRVRPGALSTLLSSNSISIHAPAKGATILKDLGIKSLIIISIHAPAKGATKPNTNHRISTFNFNPRTREGCDKKLPDNIQGYYRFQSTHPRRVRLFKFLSKTSRIINFNPRTREGCDVLFK